MEDGCVICKQPLGTLPVSTLGEKGSTTINQASIARNDTIHSLPGQQIHQECQKLTMLMKMTTLIEQITKELYANY